MSRRNDPLADPPRVGISSVPLLETLFVALVLVTLAIIAIPRWHDANVSNKVSRVMADFQRLRAAATAYLSDNVRPPRHVWGCLRDDHWVGPIGFCEEVYGSIAAGPSRLCDGTLSLKGLGGGVTSPITYLDAMPLDPFGNHVDGGADEVLYTYWSIRDYRDMLGAPLCPVPGMPGFVYALPNLGQINRYEQHFGLWVMASYGPRGVQTTSTSAFFTQYDPTNGTDSAGKIVVSEKNPRPTYTFNP